MASFKEKVASVAVEQQGFQEKRTENSQSRRKI